MIREARAEDLARIVEMGQRFIAESPYNYLGDNVTSMNALVAKLIGGGGILVAEENGGLVGMLGFVVYPHFISGEMTAGEVFWYVEPEHRGIAGLKLLREAENRALRAGAKRMQMIAPSDRVKSLYERLGYEFTEATYQKTL